MNKPDSLLQCTVRSCGLALARSERTLRCPRGHTFDAARSGYFNLLQPQDRKSKSPGDSREAVDARRRFLDAGYEDRIVHGVLEVVGALGLPRGFAVLDVGCGEGHYLGALGRRFDASRCGLDLSARAIDLAARRDPAAVWLVVNADRALPLGSASCDLVLSITARRNPVEYQRVLSSGGWLLVAIPAADDLVELREAVLGEGTLRGRVDETVAAYADGFALERHDVLRHRVRLAKDAIRDALASTYRGARASQRERLANVDVLDVTLSRDVLCFRPR